MKKNGNQLTKKKLLFWAMIVIIASIPAFITHNHNTLSLCLQAGIALLAFSRIKSI